MPEAGIDKFKSGLHFNLVRLDRVSLFYVPLIQLTSKSIPCIEF
jgi:hypothetical protein